VWWLACRDGRRHLLGLPARDVPSVLPTRRSVQSIGPVTPRFGGPELALVAPAAERSRRAEEAVRMTELCSGA
jgi:hypothetical protein